jgi:hypothetical protein
MDVQVNKGHEPAQFSVVGESIDDGGGKDYSTVR